MATSRKSGGTIEKSLLDAIEASDVTGASRLVAKNIRQGIDPWKIHLSLFPVVQRVLNPPFINPHLPKMYRVCKELVPYLDEEKVSGLIALEVMEYTRRPKMKKIPMAALLASPVAFKEIETAIRENDPEKVTVLMATFLEQKGGAEFARRVLLLGTGYLNNSLGHSLSCTAFILLEMLERTDQESWPALSTLADYFCKGQFHTSPRLKKSIPSAEKQDLNRSMFWAASGRGIVNLHHPITRYAIERVRKFLTLGEYDYTINAWIEFMGDKKEVEVSFVDTESGRVEDYGRFYETFSKLDARRMVTSVKGMISSEKDRGKLGRFIVQGLCDRYQGDYNPHYLTGLGSTLWVLDQYRNQPAIAANTLFQYLDFFFSNVGS